jgi:hypothetical protein
MFEEFTVDPDRTQYHSDCQNNNGGLRKVIVGKLDRRRRLCRQECLADWGFIPKGVGNITLWETINAVVYLQLPWSLN